jgi:outer membrane lipoprotein SlyB
MNTPVSPPKKHAVHPLIIAAAIAVLLFCAVGIAAFMGWLPSSSHGTTLNAADQTAVAPSVAVDSSSNAAALQASNTPTPTPIPVPVAQEPVPAPVVENAPPPPQASVCENCGVVESVHEITTRASGSGVGAAGGAVVGGLLGNQVGSGNGRSLATIAGAIGGAVAGNQIEGNVNAQHSFNVTVRLNDGHVRTFHHASPNWHSGDHVRIVNGELRSNG